MPLSRNEATKPAEFTQDDELYTKSETQENKFLKVLGVNWSTESDEFFLSITDLIKSANSLSVTQGSLLKMIRLVC